MSMANELLTIRFDLWNRARNRARLWKETAGKFSYRQILGTAGVLAAALLFLAVALVLGTMASRTAENAADAERAQTFQRIAGDLQDALAESSSAARAYAISHEAEHMQARKQAVAAIFSDLRILKALSADDPESTGLVNQAARDIDLRVRHYESLLSIARSPGSATAEDARLRLARLNTAELGALRQRTSARFTHFQSRVIADMRLAIFLALGAGIFAPLLGLAGMHLLRQEREYQQARELELELMHVQRLAIMGETSAMLAHEINQPLTAASNYLAVLRRQMDPAAGGGKTPSVIDRIEQQIQRAAAILAKLRRFIEKRESERRPEPPEVLAEDAITLLGTIDSSVSLKIEIAQNLPAVVADRVQIQQVLVNLMRNAIEAMQGRENRNLVLSMTATDENTVEIALADSGPGLAPEVLARLFQPFVSTKANGMGVGLSISHSIVAQHGGTIWAEPNPGGGTIFRFTLPADVEAAPRW